MGMKWCWGYIFVLKYRCLMMFFCKLRPTWTISVCKQEDVMLLQMYLQFCTNTSSLPSFNLFLFQRCKFFLNFQNSLEHQFTKISEHLLMALFWVFGCIFIPIENTFWALFFQLLRCFCLFACLLSDLSLDYE